MSQMYSWLERTMAAGFAGSICSRNSPNVPSQRCARWWRLKELSESMKSERRDGSGWSEEEESGRIVLPSRAVSE